MRDSIGSVFNLTLLFTFILLFSTFALFSVNYYRAFTLKNRILSLMESYEGNMSNSNFKEKTKDMVNKLHYHIGSGRINSQGSEWTCIADEGWCYSRKRVNYKDDCTWIYNVKTFVNTDIPVLNRIMSSSKLFEVSGSTKQIRRRGDCW